MRTTDDVGRSLRALGRQLRTGATVIAALCVLTGGALTASAWAAGTTTTPPYTSSNSYETCDSYTVSCSADAFAEHTTGRLSVDLSVIGTDTPMKDGGCGHSWTFPHNLSSCWLVGSGAHGSTVILLNQVVPAPVTAVRYTVTIHTDAASASGNSAIASLSAAATQDGLCSSCYGYTDERVVSSPANPTASSNPSAPASTRTLEFTYRSGSGKVPAGPIKVGVGLWGDVRGSGPGHVRASGTVTAITATFEP